MKKRANKDTKREKFEKSERTGPKKGMKKDYEKEIKGAKNPTKKAPKNKATKKKVT